MRFLGHVIPVRCVERAGTAAEANLFEFAQSAFAFELFDIPQATEDVRVFSNLLHGLPFHIAGADRQITAGEDLARV